LPVFAVHFFLMGLLANRFPSLPLLAQMDAAAIDQLHRRLTFDALVIMIAVGLGYGCFLYVSITELRRYFRVHAEIELASEIHHVLVPAIDTKIGDFELYGRSSPSGEVGGDLFDLAGTDDHWVAFVADVSGHGVAPGVVMGMVKSASRMLLSSGGDTGHLMRRLNEVLHPLKKPEMFVTLCFLARKGTSLQVGLAGHPRCCNFPPEPKKSGSGNAPTCRWAFFLQENLSVLRFVQSPEAFSCFTRTGYSRQPMPKEKNLASSGSKRHCRNTAPNLLKQFADPFRKTSRATAASSTISPSY
jgi:hypothetical protein